MKLGTLPKAGGVQGLRSIPPSLKPAVTMPWTGQGSLERVVNERVADMLQGTAVHFR